MNEAAHIACENCEQVYERQYPNGCKTCFGIVLSPHRACDMVRCCQSYDTGKSCLIDLSLDEAAEMSKGYASVVNAIIASSYVRPCEECNQKDDDCGTLDKGAAA